MDNITIRKEVWADEKGKPVPFGDTRGRSVLFGVGQQITPDEAKAAGLDENGELAETAPKTKAVDAAPANKSVEMAPKTK